MSHDLQSIRADLRHLNQTDLARRWRLSPRTLERWRHIGTGPRHLKVGGRVLYRLDDIEEFESMRAKPGIPIDQAPSSQDGR